MLAYLKLIATRPQAHFITIIFLSLKVLSYLMNQKQVWNKISSQWYNFRQTKFSPVYDFLERYKPKKGKILEIGCGNSRNLIPFAKLNFECFGIDFSKEMIEYSKKTAQKHNIKLNLKEADMTKLPYKTSYFDYLLHISSLHHLNSEEKVLTALNEACRILKPEGLMLLTVWNKLQLRFLLKPKDLIIPWKHRHKEYPRFYHMFDFIELKKLIQKTQFNILESNIFGKNLIFILKK